MKRLFYFLLFALLFVFSRAQSGTDSLRIALNNHKAEDSVRVNLLLKYGRSSLFTNPDSLMHRADEALRIAKKIEWPSGIADALQLKGVCYSFVLSDPVHAIDCYQKALKVNAPLGRKDFEWRTLANIAVLHYNQEEYPEALTYYQKADSVLTSIKDKSGKGRLLMNIGHVYFDIGNADKALDYYKRSLNISMNNKDSLVAANVLNSMGYIFLQKENLKDAHDYILRGLNMADVTQNNQTKASALVNMSLLNLKSADFREAEKYALDGLALSKQVNNLQFQRQAWDALQKVYDSTGRYKLSLDAYKNYVLLNDSLVNEKNKSEITRKEMQFNFDKQRVSELAELNRQRILKNSWLVGALILLVAAVTGLLLYKRKRDADARRKEAEFKSLVSDTEMKALRAQMNPHFIFNSMGAISDFLMKNNPQLADEYLHKFSALMRLVLENSEQKEVPLSDDLKTLELYMELESVRMSHPFNYKIEIADNIDPENTMVPPLLLQPFVENSIRHGLPGIKENGRIVISFRTEGDLLICNIEDNGIGIEDAKLKKESSGKSGKKSFGIKITQSRIRILNSHHRQPKATLKVSDMGKGTNVEIKLPLALNF